MSAVEQDTRPMLVVFHEPTCGLCRRTDGHLAQVLQHRQNHRLFRVRRVDVRKRPDLSERFRVETVPALVVVDHGTVKARLSNPKNCIEIRELLSPWLT